MLLLNTVSQLNPGLFLVPLFPVLWVGMAAMLSWVMGIYGLYSDFPRDASDPIGSRYRFVTIFLGSLNGHTMVSLGLGQRCLHLKEVFPFQPLFWLGPASIPWEEIRLTRRISDRGWAFWSFARFQLGPLGKEISLQGRPARALQARLDALAARGQSGPSWPA